MTQVSTDTKEPEPTASGAYNAAQVEAKWTSFWFERQLFNLKIEAGRPQFSCALPPPNITGNLHMGHALNGTLQDILVRWRRMQGYNVLWQPGTDHAGISTQMVVERELKKEGQSRHDLGREKFLEKCWQWRNKYGNAIMQQYKRLGVSFAWDRLKFTMDEDYVKAIYRAFVILFRDGYIYRGHRVTNWCPRCLTSLSDLEVEHEETKGQLYLLRYPLAKKDGGTGSPDGQALTVATTRPESMFGDVAVAVNPKDPRYQSFIGKHVLLPFSDREIPVIADDYVDTEFGTGALKVTPAHDANDWEIGQRHHLPSPVVIDQHGKLMANEFVPKQFQGKERFAARKDVVFELSETDFLAEVKDYVHGLGYCERCHTAIEPYLSEQWYCRMDELAKPAIEVVESGKIKFIPERYASTYLDWMRNMRDWNISRQLWWGHRIPVWTCLDCGNVEAFEQPPSKCTKCGFAKLEQDPDVLDTWFSSALWPFATLGWPAETLELKTFYPTTVLSTAREIINLWVARMIFTGLKFVGEIPYKHVLIHPVIQTKDGKRMSKSKGNAIDPLDMIDKYGADANRFWFASVGVKGDQDVRFHEDKLDEYKRFANKLWNAGKLILDKLGGQGATAIAAGQLTLAESWILHRYNEMLQGLEKQLENYDFDQAAGALHEFTWDYFCDWYLEISKLEIDKKDTQTKAVLFYVFESLLRAMHPIMPYISEDLWQRLPRRAESGKLESIMFAAYPKADTKLLNAAADQQMEQLIKITRAIRNIKQTFNIDPKAIAQVILVCANADEMELWRKGSEYIQLLAKVELQLSTDSVSPKMAATASVSNSKIFIPLGELIDVEKTRAKLVQQRDAVAKEVAKIKQTLDNPDFRKRAPADKVAAQEEALAQAQKQLDAINSQLELLEGD